MRAESAIAKLLSQPDDQRRLGVFHLVRPLGKGGFAPVWLAKEIYGGVELRTVAVKLFTMPRAEGSPSLFTATAAPRSTTGTSGLRKTSAGEAVRDQIVQEARALCQVEHPHIVRFLALATDPSEEVIGLAMEYVHGTPIDRRLEEKGALGLGETLAIGSAVASALSAVHQVGLVHRDVKPANVVDAAGVYKLIDFGIAAARPRGPKPTEHEREEEARGRAESAIVVMDDLPLEMMAGDPLPGANGAATPEPAAHAAPSMLGPSGTVGYMDPTCLGAGQPATPASDLYALGAMLFECVTGALPAVAAARRARATGFDVDVLEGRASPPPLAEVAPSVPAALGRLVDALLAPDPAKRPRSAEAVAWELERIRREIAGRARPLPPEERGPFRGLLRFEEEDRDVYFGRSVEIAAGLEMVRTRGLVALVGPSGSGKSSLARAGIVPAVCDGELGGWPRRWDAIVTSPGEDPRAALLSAVSPLLDEEGPRSERPEARSGSGRRDEPSPGDPEGFIAKLAERAQRSGRGVLLLIDQLEELVTTADPPSGEATRRASREFASRVLARLGEQPVPGVRALVTARRDLLGELLALPGLGRAIARGTMLVAPLDDAAWEEVVDHALAAYEYRLEDDAMRAELLAQLAGSASAMPLVQFALTRLWEKRDTERKVIPRAALVAIGGLAGALEMHAEATFARAVRGAGQAEPAGEGAEGVAREVLLSLTTAMGTRATRTREHVEAIAGAKPILAALLDARLVVREEAGVTLAHEALLTCWARLRDWIAEAKGDRLQAEELDREATAWRKEGRSPDRLLRGRRLRAAAALVARSPSLLNAAAHDFVRASRRGERRRVLAMAAPGLLAAAALGAWAVARWDASRLKVELCGAMTQRWQAYECAAVVPEASRPRRAITYRMFRRAGRVERIERVNSAGVLRPDDEGHASWEIGWSDGGKVKEIVAKDRLGQIDVREVFDGDLRRSERRDRFGNPKRRGQSDVTVVFHEYDAAGFEVVTRFANLYGSPRVDDEKAFGYAGTPDARGLFVTWDVLGADGKPSPTAEGVAHGTRTYDASGNVTETVFLDPERKPVIWDRRYASFRIVYDAHGNEVERTHFDPAGKPTLTRSGYARQTFEYDARGNRVKTALFDEAARPTLGDAGWAAAESRFDERGNEVETRYLGTSAQTTLTKDGFARVVAKYDLGNNRVELALFDPEGRPAAHLEGWAVSRRSFDARGNEIEGAWFGVDGKPAVVNGHARFTVRYDERDNPVETAYFGETGQAVVAGDGFARRVSKFDERGRETETTYFAPDGAPMLKDKEGHARATYRYDDRGNVIEQSFFGVGGRLALRTGGYAILSDAYDDRGNKTEESFTGTDGKPAIYNGAYARRVFTYDEQGRHVSDAYFGTDGKPILYAGVARWVARFDVRGREVERSFYGIDGALQARPEGYARRVVTYDDRGNVTSTRYFDAAGKPALHQDGVAGWTARFGESVGLEIERAYFGVRGEPVRYKEGFARTTAKYDGQGKEIERAYFGVDDKPTLHQEGYFRKTARFDARGNEVERATFGVDDKPTLRDGYARFVRTLDDRGSELEIAYYDERGAAKDYKDGFARRTARYDERGNRVGVALFGADGATALHKDGYASFVARYDQRDREIEKRYFGKEGAPVLPRAIGFARATTRYDDRGNEAEKAYFDTDDAPVLKEGAARWTATYDDGNRRTSMAWFGADGRPVPGEGGAARVTSRFDVYGNELEHALFGPTGAPATHAEGWSSWRATRSEAGHEVERVLQDERGEPTTTKAGYARVSSRYDDRGNLLERAYFDAAGKAVLVAAEGGARWARTVVRWDDRGNEIDRAFFGADGAPIAAAGWARRTARYNRQGSLVEESFFDTQGRYVVLGARVGGAAGRSPLDHARMTAAYDAQGRRIETVYYADATRRVAGPEGWSRMTKRYDARGKETETAYFDSDDRPTRTKAGACGFTATYDDWGNEIERVYRDERGGRALSGDGYASFRAKFDTRNLEVEVAYFDALGKPAKVALGFAKVVSTYDARGHRVAVDYLDASGGKALHKDGYAGWRARFDDRDNEVERTYVGTDGAPKVTKQGFARTTRAYDADGNLTEERWFDAALAPTRGEGGCKRRVVTYEDGQERSRQCQEDP